MNWLTLTCRNLSLKPYFKFQLIFSVCILSTASVLWACGGEEPDDYSIFSPEYFVDKQYSPFFYDSQNANYGTNSAQNNDQSNINDLTIEEWYNDLDKKVSKDQLAYLFLNAKTSGVDSVYHYLTNDIPALAANFPTFSRNKLQKRQLKKLFGYLKLAKACEKFANQPNTVSWEPKVDTIAVDAGLMKSLKLEFDQSKDQFIKEHLWFQLVRAAYFDDRVNYKADTLNIETIKQSPIFTLFEQHEKQFPKNLIYYRTMGYVAGYYYRHKQYAQSNYLYSLCYNYTSGLKISCIWSFHPQDESDWKEALSLAKNNEEKITLWQMLGYWNDPGRAIKEIATINPRSEKLDLLLARLINIAETNSYKPTVDESELHYNTAFPFTTDSATIKSVNALNNSAYHKAYDLAYNAAIVNGLQDKDLRLVDSISSISNIAKPYYWHLATGYLHYLHYDYKGSEKYYTLAKKELPTGDSRIMAQYKLLDILLSVHQLNRIDSKVESQLTEPLTWLANLHDRKDTVADLRFEGAVNSTVATIAEVYSKQGNKVKALLFNNSEPGFYKHYNNVDSVINLINKTGKTVFERVMLRYYPIKKEQLYDHQALLMAYQEKTDAAIGLMEHAGDSIKNTLLLANPFNSRLNDCHDCDFDMVQKHKYTFLNFLQTIKVAKNQLDKGDNVYTNAFLLANAYYNVSYYGNGRLFYSGFLVESAPAQSDIMAVDNIFYSQNLAEKYYKIALKNASNNEQRANCTFMLSKCERNEYYNGGGEGRPSAGEYFTILKAKYAKTNYYSEVLKECGYFKYYVDNL